VKVSKFIPKVVTRSVGRQVLSMKKNSPHIFFAAGIVGVVGSTVLACRATLKVSDVLDELHDDVDMVKKNHHLPEERSKDLAYVYGRGGAKIVMLYAPSVILGTASIAALTGSHVQLTRRNTALTAAYTGLSKAYDAYRVRVREEVGEERELDLYHAAKEETIIGDDGSEVTIKTVDSNNMSPYSRFFDELNVNWKKNAELNRLFVQCQQNYSNHLLHARGHVFLNEVYDMLGIERCAAGQVVGWMIGDEGDNYIDFGMFEARNSAFINGLERSILLDFNVDGVIYNKL